MASSIIVISVVSQIATYENDVNLKLSELEDLGYTILFMGQGFRSNIATAWIYYRID